MEKLNDILDYKIIDTHYFELYSSQFLSIFTLILVTFFILKVIKKMLFRKINSDHERMTKSLILKILRYFFWTSSLVACLEILGIHLTLLLASSAALLVGLGLGIQDIFKDVISGVLLLTEGTIKINQIIQVDNMVVKVKEIHLRTSKVLTRNDVMIILPNHKFTSENVINWSSSDQGITRFEITIGVAYDSDIDLVTELLLLSMNENANVSNSPDHEPIVRLRDFGDSALIFDAIFYSENIFRVQNTESEIRYNIVRKFREHQIVIPFPQRDLYIKN